MDPLSVLTIPHILQGAAKAVSFAWNQYSLVEEHKDRCKLLIERCQDIIVKVAKLIDQDEKSLQGAMRTNITVLESACMKIKETVAHLASKVFIWRVLHQSEVAMVLKAADDAVIDAYSRFNMSSLLNIHQLQSRITAAAIRDQSYLASRLQTLERNDDEILGVLRTTGLRVEELFVTFMKFTQNPRQTSPPAQAFIQKAANTLKKLSNASDVTIPRWSLTSLEVEFDRTNKASCVGRGRFGSIYRGQWDGLIVAVKEMHVTEAQALDETQLNIIRREIEIWSSLTHPHVLPFYGACLEAPQPFMVSRLCSKGNALQYLRKYPHADRITLMLGIALGMVYLHRKGIIHADIKALNILIGDDGEPLIADFGLSKIQDQIASTLSGRASHQPEALDGTLRWLAPERLDGARLEKPSDVYSFGITAWELFAETIPFADLPDRALLFVVVDRKKRPERPTTMANDSVWTLVQQCWDSAPSVRPTFDDIRIILQSLLFIFDTHEVNDEGGSSSQSPNDASRNEVLTDDHHLGLFAEALPSYLSTSLSTEFTAVGQAQLSMQDTAPEQGRHQMTLQRTLPGFKPLLGLPRPLPRPPLQPASSKTETALSLRGQPTIYIENAYPTLPSPSFSNSTWPTWSGSPATRLDGPESSMGRDPSPPFGVTENLYAIHPLKRKMFAFAVPTGW